MALNSSGKDSIQARREQVANLRLQGKTQREIAEKLNISAATVNRDLAALVADWQQRAGAALDHHIGRQYAELEQIKRAAWAEDDLKSVLKALEVEIKLLGTAQPSVLELRGADSRALADLLEALKRQGMSAGDVFAAMLNEIAQLDTTNDE